MKTGYAIAFAVTVLVLCYGVMISAKSDRKIARTVGHLLGYAAVAALANLVAIISESESISLGAYSVYYACLDWTVYYMLIYAAQYTGHEIGMKTAKRIMGTILGVDSISMLLNAVLHHAFLCGTVQTKTGEIYYHIEPLVPYYVHLGVVYVLVGTILLFLIVKTVQSPMVYHPKYIVVLLLFGIIVVANFVYKYTGQAVDLSVIFYSIAGLSFYYAAVVYSPRSLLSNTLLLVVDGMSEAVVLFGAEGECLRVNESARRMFGIIDDNQQLDVGQMFAEFIESRKDSGIEGETFDYSLMWNGTERHLRIEYRRMEDKRKRYQGSFFVIRDQTEEVNHLAEEHYRATHDSLTGLYDKHHFYEQAEKCLREHPGEQFLMVCSNIRNFKMVNDIFGPRAGDDLLKKIGNALRELTRPGEIYGRLESDRFALLMRREDYREQIFVQKPQELIRIDSDLSYPVEIYVGVYDIKNPELPVQTMCDRAFMAINAIKDSYQNRVAYYDDTLRNSLLQEQELLAEMEPAMETGQFHIYLQPQITVAGEVHGAEALVRWIHPDKGMIGPGVFINAFERNGIIYKLDQHIWELACRQLRMWKDQGHSDMYISVNISPRDFYYLDIYKVMVGLVEKYDISPRNLKLEITETAVMSNLESQLVLIDKLRSAGFIIEMDDFGSGYSSLNMLKDIRVDILKVDMAFLGKTSDEERGRKILKRVIEMSKDLGMPVITEGVETEEQVNYLTKIGCDMFQGYYFAKPMPIPEFEQKYMQGA